MKTSSSQVERLDGSSLRINIILARYNNAIGEELLKNCLATLQKNFVRSITIHRVPGCLETPLATQKVIQYQKPDVVIVLGVVIRGDTFHFEMVCQESYRGLMEVMLKTKIPVICGILTVNSLAQAKERSSSKKMNKGKEYAFTAIEMGLLIKNLRREGKKLQ